LNETYYAAYGSNLNCGMLRVRCPFVAFVGKGILRDARLVFKATCNNYAYSTLQMEIGINTPVFLYKLTDLDIFFLDKYEGDSYVKKNVDIETETDIIQAFIYIMIEDSKYKLPSEGYLDSVMMGYRLNRFDMNYLDEALLYTKNLI